MPRKAEGLTPVPNASARSGRCRARSRVRAWQVRPPKSKWPRVFRVAGHSGRVAGGLPRLLKPVLG